MKPSIESDIKGPVPFGELIHLECKVNITAGVDLSMKWVIPQNKTLNKTIESNIRSGPLKVVRTKGAELMYAMSGELIIKKAIQANMGSYWCIVEDQNGNKNSERFQLYVHEPPEDYVMLREENNLSVINVRLNAYGFTSPIDVVFEYRSYPAIITYYWLNDSGQKIMTGHKNKYKLSHTDTRVKLRINEPNVFDTGIYTVFVTAGNATQSRRMEVYVHAKPIVQMQSKFVKMGEQVSFLCRSIGFPRPEITFLFQPCSNKPKWTNCFSQAPAASGWDSPRGIAETKIANSQVLVHTAKVPGVVYCTATNSEGSEVTQADLLVSDLPDAITMEIEHPMETITVGDNVTVVCSALVYNYTNDITFARNGIDMTGVWTKYSEELYAEQARFNIESVQHEDGGTFRCQVKTIYDTYETRYLHLQVLDPVKPILKSGKNNETLVVELTSPLRLECDVIGTPDPKIIWLKDGIPVVPEEGSSRVQLNRTTLIFEYLREKESGMYECRAENKIGRIEKYWNVDVRTTVVRKSLIYAIIALLLLLIVAIVLVSLFYCKKKKEVKAMKEAGIVNFEEGLKYVNLSFSTNNVNHHPLQHHPTAFYHNHIDSGSSQYVDPKKHLNSKGYVRHSGMQNMAMVDSCNTEVTAMTSVEGNGQLQALLQSKCSYERVAHHYMELNEPYLQMNAEKVERGDTDYLVNLGPPEEPAPAAPNYVNGIILPLPPKIRNNKDYLKMSRTKSDSEESNFDFASFNSERHSPTIRNNLDTSPPNGSKRHKKRGLPEEIPMLDGSRLSSAANGFHSDSETEAGGPMPRERTSKHNQPEPEYMNVKNHKFTGRAPNDEPAGGTQEAISNPGYIALSMVDEKRC
uniref:Ig-like domain-containing protein n=1 Tax=Anopheles dirus TaxID=7168 RepID=A0A182NT45_9DIPT